MHFAANLTYLCEDISDIGQKYRHLSTRPDYKFTAVECHSPYVKSLEEWDLIEKECPHKMKWVLINTPALFERDIDQYSLSEFDIDLQQARDYARKLKIPKVHVNLMDAKNEEQRSKAIQLVDYAAKLFQPDGTMVLIEPISTWPNYYLRSYHLAQEIVTKLNHANLKIMLDTFHLQRFHGNLTEMIEQLSPYVGHVQISQVPLRDCPIGEGEINHRYVFKQIGKFYNDYVGLEFKNKSQESFSWLNEFTS